MLTQTPIFVLSSGRTGSTLLARLINHHPRLLCVSDLFEPIGDEPYFDRGSVVDGEEFFDILSRPSLPQRIEYWRAQPTDELLYLPEDDADVSLLMSYTLPFLTGGDPTPLREELEQEVRSWGPAAMPDHLIRFFDCVRDQFGMELWVERTGGSLPHTRRILETWPEAKVVHNYRDPHETALSMLHGSFFRLYLELTKDPGLEEWDWDGTPPPAEMGALLNDWVVDAVDALHGFPPERRTTLSYEDLCTEPLETLLDLAAFIFERDPSPEDRTWATREAAGVRPAPLRFESLPAEEQARLSRACAPARTALGYR